MNILTELRMSLNPVRISFRSSGLVRMVSFLAISMYFSWAYCLVFRLQCRPYLLSTKLRLKNGVLRRPSIGIVSTDSVSGCLVSVPGSWLNNQFVVCKFANAIFRVSCCMLGSCRSVFLCFALSWLYISLLTLTAFRSLQFSGRLYFPPSPSTAIYLKDLYLFFHRWHHHLQMTLRGFAVQDFGQRPYFARCALSDRRHLGYHSHRGWHYHHLEMSVVFCCWKRHIPLQSQINSDPGGDFGALSRFVFHFSPGGRTVSVDCWYWHIFSKRVVICAIFLLMFTSIGVETFFTGPTSEDVLTLSSAVSCGPIESLFSVSILYVNKLGIKHQFQK